MCKLLKGVYTTKRGLINILANSRSNWHPSKQHETEKIPTQLSGDFLRYRCLSRKLSYFTFGLVALSLDLVLQIRVQSNFLLIETNVQDFSI